MSMELKSMSNVPQSETFDPFAMVRSDHGCFGCGDDNPIGLHLRFAIDGDGVQASFIPDADHQGFGGIVHGGIISTILDEAMAWATAHAGFWAMTGDMRVRFRRPLNIGELTVVTARVSGARGRLVTTVGELVLESDGSAVATATATFVKVDPELEAAWRAQYLRESDTLEAKVRQETQKAAGNSVERDTVSQPGEGALALEHDR
jgi:acyl-coenzyme A thioesterase PaaI-like protein